MEITSGLGGIGIQPFNVASFAVAHLKQGTTNPVKQTHHPCDADFGGIVRALAVSNASACDFYVPYTATRPLVHAPPQPWIHVADSLEAGPSGLMPKLERCEDEEEGLANNKNSKKRQKKGSDASTSKQVAQDEWPNCRYNNQGANSNENEMVNAESSSQTAPVKKKKQKKKASNRTNGNEDYGAKMDLMGGDFEHVELTNCTVSSCPICKMKFRLREELVVHMQVHLQNERITNYSECPICKCIVKDTLLLDHIVGHATELFVCPTCEFSFSTEQELRTHYETHRENQLRVCETCGEKFSDTQSYNLHLEKHMEKLYDVPLPPEKAKGERSDTRFTCTICGNSFAWRKGLKRHIVCVHAKIRDHGCPLCDKKFSRPEHLRRHVLRHTGEKPYHCQTCGKSFIDRYSLSQHCRTHVKPRIGRSSCSAEPQEGPQPCGNS